MTKCSVGIGSGSNAPNGDGVHARAEFGVDCLRHLLMRLGPCAVGNGVAIDKRNQHRLGATDPGDDGFGRLRGRCLDGQAEKGAG